TTNHLAAPRAETPLLLRHTNADEAPVLAGGQEIVANGHLLGLGVDGCDVRFGGRGRPRREVSADLDAVGYIARQKAAAKCGREVTAACLRDRQRTYEVAPRTGRERVGEEVFVA